MTTRRYALRDDQWARIEGLLPGRAGYVGGTAADNRLFVDAVLYRFRAGIAWRDLPERFGQAEAVEPACGRLFGDTSAIYNQGSGERGAA